MTIIIKEIHVHTRIGQEMARRKEQPEELRRFRKELLQEVRQIVRREIKQNEER